MSACSRPAAKYAAQNASTASLRSTGRGAKSVLSRRPRQRGTRRIVNPDLNVRVFAPCGEVCRPERIDRLPSLDRERSEVCAFKATETERYTAHRESTLLAKLRAKLAGGFR